MRVAIAWRVFIVLIFRKFPQFKPRCRILSTWLGEYSRLGHGSCWRLQVEKSADSWPNTSSLYRPLTLEVRWNIFVDFCTNRLSPDFYVNFLPYFFLTTHRFLFLTTHRFHREDLSFLNKTTCHLLLLGPSPVLLQSILAKWSGRGWQPTHRLSAFFKN